MQWTDNFPGVWHYLVAALTIGLSVLASGHAVLYKRDSRAAVIWVGLIWLAPLVGAVLYFLVGVNRIRRQAVLLRASTERYHADSLPACGPGDLLKTLSAESAHLGALAHLVDGVAARPPAPGNLIKPLINGDEAFPEMLQAIRSARTSITFSTYIFDSSPAGMEFVRAFGDAVKRGVEVRVLIDDTGLRYSWPTVLPSLHRARVPVARFLRATIFRPMSINLRNHRKILVIDGRVGFTGGMNIRQGNLLKARPRRPVQDIQFRVEGPVVAQLQEVFADDWLFTTRETLKGDKWFPKLESRGGVVARGITDGPDEDFEKLRWTILGALSCAQKTVRIVTPYFLPDQALISALNVAAMRGVDVDIILTGKNNLPYVQWATFAILWQMLERGCRVWLTPPPFDHSKLMIVDGQWVLIGSANWDPRSLRLNFEFNLECYSRELAGELDVLVRERLGKARPVTLKEVNGRPLPVRLRDGVARLLTPYL